MDQVPFDIWRARKATAPAGMLPIPVAAYFKIENIVGLLGAELEVFAKVAVDSGGENTRHGGVRGIAFGVFSKQVVGGPRKTRIVTPDRESVAALEFGAKLPERDAQLRLDDVVLAQAGEARELFRDVRSFRVAEMGALHQSSGVFGGSEMA